MRIAIDGPAGAGKSTIARMLANKLGFTYIDTGAMYRALTWKAITRGVATDDVESLREIARTTHIHFHFISGEQHIFCDDQDVTEAIRSPQVTAQVSLAAAHPEVREYMVKMQKNLARSSSVVMDGRDIGECVLPDADYKFFITASLEERARRRIRELKDKGYPVDSKIIGKELQDRDYNDSHREVGALKVLEDSIVIDTTNMDIEEVLNSILAVIQGV
ncbi:(d)CMP kinase [Syntrophomonas erecta]